MMSLHTRSANVLEPTSPAWLREILPQFNERAILVGRTGSGKTTLAEQICRHFPYVVVYDAKRRIAWDGFARYETFAALTAAPDFHTHMIYSPIIQERLDVRGDFAPTVDQFFWWVFARENTFLYVDEVKLITHGDFAPMGYRACITSGRELNIAVMSATQRPRRIPQEILSETEHVYAFALQLDQDRDRMVEVTGYPFPTLAEHDFGYLRVGGGRGFERLRLALAS